MKSTIKLDVDFDGKPFIKIHKETSDEINDKMIDMFLSAVLKDGIHIKLGNCGEGPGGYVEYVICSNKKGIEVVEPMRFIPVETKPSVDEFSIKWQFQRRVTKFIADEARIAEKWGNGVAVRTLLDLKAEIKKW